MNNIKFLKVENPKVSIIIPVYNQINYTLACLKSIQEAKDSTSIEIIVVDDCSNDETEEILSKIEGIIYHRNTENLGFVKNNNLAAKLAKGEYLFLLNNDTTVTDGYLEWLLEIFNKFPDAAVAGSKLIYPDGRLQEAGGHIYKSGNGFNYGKFQDPYNFNYNFVREVHYCSGAAILIKKSIFEELGMFGEEYAPAYYEDTDFQIKTQKAGYKNYYQPKSVIIHYEGVSNGKDLGNETVGLKKHQYINRETFLKAHKSWLDKNAYEEDYSKMDLQIFPKEKEHVFYFENQIPYPDLDSGSLRAFNLLNILQEKYQVTMIINNQVYEEKYYDMFAQNKIRVVINKDNNYIELKDFFEKNGNLPKYVIISRPESAFPQFQSVKKYFSKSKIIYDTVDLHHVRWQSMLKILDPSKSDYLDKKNWLEKGCDIYKSLEIYVCRNSDEVWGITEEENNYLVNEMGIEPKRIKLIPNILNINPTKNSYEKRKNMVFIGNYFHTPNLNSIEYYCEKIAPLLDKNNLNIKLDIIGSNPQNIASAGIKLKNSNLIGFVEEVDPYFNDALFAFFPLIDGAGMKGKVTQALALGLPVITTDFGAQGYENAKDYMLIGNTPEELIECIKIFLNNKEVWEEKREKGLKYIEKNLSINALRSKLHNL